MQTTRFRASPYKADSGNLQKFGATFRYGTVFAPKQCLYEKSATGVESLKGAINVHPVTGLQTTRFRAAPNI